MARADWGKGKHQVFILRDEICALLDGGNNLEEIYQELFSKKIIVGKSTFKRHASAIIKSRNQSLGSIASAPSSRLVNGTPGVTAHQSNLPADVTSGTTHLSAPSRPSTFDHSPEAGDEIIRAFFDGDK